MFPLQNIHKYTWTSPDGNNHNHIDHILIDRRCHSSILMYDLSGELTVILVVAKLREILAVSKEAAHKTDVEIFHLRNWRLGKNFRLSSQTGLQLYRN